MFSSVRHRIHSHSCAARGVGMPSARADGLERSCQRRQCLWLAVSITALLLIDKLTPSRAPIRAPIRHIVRIQLSSVPQKEESRLLVDELSRQDEHDTTVVMSSPAPSTHRHPHR